jgi:N-acetylglucosamine kinase-like BadF-type ATPase
VVVVAIDAGQSGVRGVATGGGPERRTQGAGFAEPLADPGAPGRVTDALVTFIGRLAPDGVDRVAVGLSGIDQADEGVVEVARAVRERTGARSVRIASDVVTWHLAAFGGGPGVVAAVGTGSVALAADGAGACARTDGWGHLLGDQASGFAVGRAGLASALAAFDGRGGSSDLLERAVRRFGPAAGIAAMVHGSGAVVAACASFAADVVESARSGDAVAIEIWDTTGRALGSMIVGAWHRVFTRGQVVPVAVVGSLVEAGRLVLEPCDSALERHGLVASVPALDALTGALRLATTSLGTYPDLVVEECDA